MPARTYRTIDGDAFDGIAFRLFGDEHLARRLIDANPAHADVLLFGPGVTLTIPEIDTTARPPRALPPWYRALEDRT